MKLSKLVLALPLVVGLSGCVIAVGDHDGDRWSKSGWKQRQNENRQHIDNLNPGMPYAEVRSTMGRPDFKESFDSNGEKVVVLFYRTDSVKSDGVTSKDECTPLVFKNDRLQGWGMKAYERI